MGIFKHIHLEECHSTQEELKCYLNDNSDNESILISTARQAGGRGRRDNKWLNNGTQIALSLNLKANHELTLTPLEMSVLTAQFILDKFGQTIYLKWPNDLLNSNHKKVGGVLCEVKGNNILVGIGLNLFNFSTETKFTYPAGNIFNTERDICLQTTSNDLATYIINNRIDSAERTQEYWKSLCMHIDQNVVIEDCELSIAGNFKSIGQKGEAILKIQDKELPIYTGSLKFNHS